MEELYNAIETLNKEKNETKKSKEYKLGKAICMYFSDIVNFRYKKIIKNLKNKKVSKIIKKKYYHPDKYEYTENDIDYKNKKIAIYTCILNNYDKLQKPLVKFDNVEYFIITDNVDKYKEYRDIYKIIEIPKEISDKGNIIANRYVKLHPKNFFEGYDYAIYLDGNVRVVSDIRTFIKRCSTEIGIAMHIHRERNCIYEEAEVCKMLGRGNVEKINEQIEKYQKEEFPKKYGMNEATIIVSNLKNDNAYKLLDEWYLEFINSESLRDQLAWPYILWKNHYKITDVGILGNNIYENYKVEMINHDGN